MAVTEQDVRAALATVKDPEIRRPITDLDMVQSLAVSQDGVVELTGC
jgi:ATP-binding protein involved in chromosome partitioning